MPELIGEALIAYGMEAGTAFAIEAGSWIVANAGVISTVGALAITNAQAQSAKRKARDAAAASAQDRAITFRGATLPRREVLGRAITGGDLVWPASTGAAKTSLVMVLALSAREIDGVEKVFYDGEEITLDVNGYANSGPFASAQYNSLQAFGTTAASGGTVTLSTPADPARINVVSANWDVGDVAAQTELPFTLSTDRLTVNVGASAYAGPVVVNYQVQGASASLRIIIHRGEAGQAVDSAVTALFPTEWDASHTLTGIAYAVIVANYDPSAFPQGLNGISFLVRGSKVLDPRTSTTAWTDNPALLVRHIATTPLDPAINGVAVDDAACIAAANVCDQTVTYTVGGVSKTRKRYIAGTIYSDGEAPIKAIDELCQAMAGGRVFAAGKLRMRAGAYSAPVMSLGDSDFMGGAVDVVPALPREQLVNVANGKAWDPDNRWQFVDVPEVRSSTYITADGGALPPLSVDMAAVPDMAQAQQLLAVMLREARAAFTITAQFRMTAYPLELFDTATVMNSRYMTAPLTMLLVGRRWSLDGGLVLTFRATAASVYADGTAFDEPAVPAANLLPLPWSVAAPGALTIDSDPSTLGDSTQTSRMQVSWPLHPDAAVRNGGAIEVQYRPADEAEPAGEWPGVKESGRSTSTVVRGVQQGRIYLVRARAWNGPAVSAWGVAVTHKVEAAPLVTRSNLAENAAATVAATLIASQTDSIPVGIAAWQVIMCSTSVGPFDDDEPVELTFGAKRIIRTTSGNSTTIFGAAAAYHFIRLYRDGVFWFNFPTATDNINDAILPLPAGTRLQITHSNNRTVLLEAGKVLTAESVWTLSQPEPGEDLTVDTKAAEMRLTVVHK